VIEERGSRLEIAAVALALLLPIPLFAASGLRLPLPEAIERGLASLAAGGGFEPAEAEAAPVRPETSSVSTGVAPGGPAAATDTRAAGSGQAPTVTDAGTSSVRDDEREKLSGDDGDRPPPESDGDTPLGGGNSVGGGGNSVGGGGNSVGGGGNSVGDSGGDSEDRSLEATVVAATDPESTQAEVTIDLDAAGASAEIDVVEGGVEVDATAPGVDVEVDTPPAVPVPPPPPSLP